MRSYQSVRLSTALATFALASICCTSISSSRVPEYPVMASSGQDVRFISKLLALSPTVRNDEARRVAMCAYSTGQEFKRKWRVVWPPGLQVILANTGKKKGGLCYRWAAELLVRLDALKLQTLETHWAESFANTMSEHNVIVVTARGQLFSDGILLDNWRYGGNLIYGKVAADPEYKWIENNGEIVNRLRAATISASQSGQPKPVGTKSE